MLTETIKISSLIPIVFFIVLGFYLWYTFAITYHLIRFGIGAKPKAMALIFFVGSFILFALAFIAYQEINWGFLK